MLSNASSGISPNAKVLTYQEGVLLPVLNADELLFSSRHKGLLRQLCDISGLAQSEFDEVYGVLIRQFMEFVQILPHKPNGILGSLLNYHLARAVATFVKYNEARRSASALYKFAVFSAALLKELGLVMSNQRVVLVTDTGDFVRDWNPFAGSMIGQAPYFKMYPVGPKFMRIESEVTLMLARQLIARDIFTWLSNDFALFSDWVCALLDHEGSGIEEIGWALSIVKREDIMAMLAGLEGATVDMGLPVATEHAEAFYRWLKEGLEKGEITVNKKDSLVHYTKDGVFIEKKLFQQFSDLMKLTASVVYAHFGNLMGIVKTCGEDFFFAKFISADTTPGNYSSFATSLAQKSSAREGMVVNARDVFMGKDIPEKTDQLKSAKILNPVRYHLLQTNSNININTINPSTK